MIKIDSFNVFTIKYQVDLPTSPDTMPDLPNFEIILAIMSSAYFDGGSSPS